MAYIPTNEVVGIAWLNSLSGVPTNKVNTTLPKAESWQDTGFIQILTVSGGGPDMYTPMYKPVFQLDFWASNPNSPKPPWREANNLACIVQNACWVQSNFGHLATRSEYENVRTFTANSLSDPVRVPEDNARFAHYRFELQLYWVRTVSPHET